MLQRQNASPRSPVSGTSCRWAMAANRRFAFDQITRLPDSAFRRCLNTGDAATDYQWRMNRYFEQFERFLFDNTLQRHRRSSRALAVAFCLSVCPRYLLTNRHSSLKYGLSRRGRRHRECFFVQMGRTGSDNDTGRSLFGNGLLDHLLPRLEHMVCNRAGTTTPSSASLSPAQTAASSRHRRHGDVAAAVAT